MPPSPPTPAVLTIAGSDPSGGAGVQADLKTCTVRGVYSAAAITCLTAQNTRGVQRYMPVEPEFVAEQINLVLTDLKPSHVKIGMVGTGEIAAAIGDCLTGFKGEVVYDPVLKASSGADLFKEGGLAILKRTILACATVLTPNTTELALLAGSACQNHQQIEAAGRRLLEELPNLAALVVTGGHCQEEAELVTDHLLLRRLDGGIDIHQAHHPRIATRNSHGTGCTFASAFAAYHLLTGSYVLAFQQAVALLGELLEKSSAASMGSGNGPLLHHLHLHQV